MALPASHGWGRAFSHHRDNGVELPPSKVGIRSYQPIREGENMLKQSKKRTSLSILICFVLGYFAVTFIRAPQQETPLEAAHRICAELRVDRT